MMGNKAEETSTVRVNQIQETQTNVIVDVKKLSQGLKTTFEGVAMVLQDLRRLIGFFDARIEDLDQIDDQGDGARDEYDRDDDPDEEEIPEHLIDGKENGDGGQDKGKDDQED